MGAKVAHVTCPEQQSDRGGSNATATQAAAAAITFCCPLRPAQERWLPRAHPLLLSHPSTQRICNVPENWKPPFLIFFAPLVSNIFPKIWKNAYLWLPEMWKSGNGSRKLEPFTPPLCGGSAHDGQITKACGQRGASYFLSSIIAFLERIRYRWFLYPFSRVVRFFLAFSVIQSVSQRKTTVCPTAFHSPSCTRS